MNNKQKKKLEQNENHDPKNRDCECLSCCIQLNCDEEAETMDLEDINQQGIDKLIIILNFYIINF